MQKAAKENVFVVCTVAVCFLVTLSLCFILGGKGYLLAAFSNRGEHSFYAIATGGYEDRILARTTAELIKSRGGAGYVTGDGEYEIIYAVYPDENSAKKVLSALGESGAYIKEIQLSSPSFKKLDGDTKAAAKEAMKYFQTAFDCLYKVGNDLGAGNLTPSDAKIQIAVLRAQIEDIKSEFYNFVQSNDNSATVEIKLALITALALLDNMNFDGDEAATASSVRYGLVQLTLSWAALNDKI